MSKDLDRTSPTTIQIQLYESLKEWFTADFEPGSLLPTEFSIATKYGVGRGTVRVALENLSKEGIIHRIAGKGTFLNKNFFIRLKKFRIGIILSMKEFGAYKAREYSWVHHMEMLNGIFAESVRLNVQCELIPEETVTSIVVNKYDGFILFRGIQENIVSLLSKPLVNIHYDINLYGGIEQIARHVVQCGYLNVAYIGSLQKGRLEVVNQIFQNEKKSKIENNAIIECDGTSEDGYDAAKKLFKMVTDVDCVICSTDLRAIGVLDYLNKQNIDVPNQVSVYGFDGIRKSEVSNPPLSTCHFDWQNPGEFAVKSIRAILDHRSSPNFIPLEGKLVIRKSSKAL